MSRRRYRGSVVGVYVPSTTTGASGVWDLDTQFSRLQKSAWPAATAGLYKVPARAIFGFGTYYTTTTVWTNTTTLVSTTGVVAADVVYGSSDVTARSEVGAAGYDLDKAVFVYGESGNNSNIYRIVNLATNLGVLGNNEATLAPGPGRLQCGSATIGLNKAIFSFGYNLSGGRKDSSLFSETGVWTNDVSTTASLYHNSTKGVGFGNDRALMYSNTTKNASSGGTLYSGGVYNYVSNTGVVGTENTVANTEWYAAFNSVATRYGPDTAVLTSFTQASKSIAYITNTGVLGSDQTVTRTTWYGAGTTYSGGKAIMLGYSSSANQKILVTDTGVIGSETAAGAGTGLISRGAAGYSLS